MSTGGEQSEMEYEIKKYNSIFNRKKASVCSPFNVPFVMFVQPIVAGCKLRAASQKFASVISLSTIWLWAISFARIFRSVWIRMTLMLLFSPCFYLLSHSNFAHIFCFIRNVWYQQQLNGLQQSKHLSLNGLEFFSLCMHISTTFFSSTAMEWPIFFSCFERATRSAFS